MTKTLRTVALLISPSLPASRFATQTRDACGPPTRHHRNSRERATLPSSMARSMRGFGWLVLAGVALTACGRIAPGTAIPTASGVRVEAGCHVSAVNTGAPSPRSNAAFAFDIDHNLMVLFGGGTTQELGDGQADTWTWDITGWTRHDPAQS